MENIPNGNQGNSEDIKAGMEDLTEAEESSTQSRERGLAKLDKLAEEAKISPEEKREVLESAHHDGYHTVNFYLRGKPVKIETKTYDRRAYASVEGKGMSEQTAKGLDARYYELAKQAAKIKSADNSSESAVREERRDWEAENSGVKQYDNDHLADDLLK